MKCYVISVCSFVLQKQTSRMHAILLADDLSNVKWPVMVSTSAI